jgi:hypothetical protein
MIWLRALCLLGLLSAAAPVAAQPVSLSALAATVGLVEGAGDSQSFTLIDAGVSVRVLAAGGARARTGDRVEVEGLFKLAGNLIEAFRITLR